MPDYINFHSRNFLTKKFISLVINILVFFPDWLFCFVWNLILLMINNSVRISLIKDDRLLVKDKIQSIEIVHKKRFEFYLQNISKRLDHISYEYMLDSVKFSPGDIIVDCGANVGELIYSFHQKNIAINYIAFEPESSSFSSLTMNTNQFENSISHKIALSDFEGNVDFFIDSLGGNSSLEYFGNNEKVSIETKKLDSYNLKNIKLLKVEAEGHEEEVLKGALKSINYTEFISVDYGPEKGTNQESTISQVIKLLHDNNFQLVQSSKHRQIGLFKNQKL